MKTVLPALSESTVFAYKLDIVSGQWSRWKDNLPSISASFVVSQTSNIIHWIVNKHIYQTGTSNHRE